MNEGDIMGDNNLADETVTDNRTRTKQANPRTEEANTRTDEANIRTEQAAARSVQAILASELRYRRLFETAQDGILILDAETGQVVDANPFMKDLLGYASGYSAEIAGKDFPLEEGVNFLTKPFQAQKLAQTVREKLDANKEWKELDQSNNSKSDAVRKFWFHEFLVG